MNIARIFSFSVYALALVPLGLNWELFEYVRDSGGLDGIGESERMRLIGGIILTLAGLWAAVQFVEPIVRQKNESIREALIEWESKRGHNRRSDKMASAVGQAILAVWIFISSVFIVNVIALFSPQVLTVPASFVFDALIVDRRGAWVYAAHEWVFGSSYFIEIGGVHYRFNLMILSFLSASVLYILMLLLVSFFNARTRLSALLSMRNKTRSGFPISLSSVWINVLKLPVNLSVIPLLLFWMLAHDGYFRSDGVRNLLIDDVPIYSSLDDYLDHQESVDRAIYVPAYTYVFKAQDDKYYALMMKIVSVQYHQFVTEDSGITLLQNDELAFYSVVDLVDGNIVSGGPFRSCDGSLFDVQEVGRVYPGVAGNNEIHFMKRNFKYVSIINSESLRFCVKGRSAYLDRIGISDLNVVGDEIGIVEDFTHGNSDSFKRFEFIDFEMSDGQKYRYKINDDMLAPVLTSASNQYRELRESKYLANSVEVHRGQKVRNSSEMFRIVPNGGIPGDSWLHYGHPLLAANILSHDADGVLIEHLDQVGSRGSRVISWINKDNILAWTYRYDGDVLPPPGERDKIGYRLVGVSEDVYIVYVEIYGLPLRYLSINKESGNINWQYQMPVRD